MSDARISVACLRSSCCSHGPICRSSNKLPRGGIGHTMCSRKVVFAHLCDVLQTGRGVGGLLLVTCEQSDFVPGLSAGYLPPLARAMGSKPARTE